MQFRKCLGVFSSSVKGGRDEEQLVHNPYLGTTSWRKFYVVVRSQKFLILRPLHKPVSILQCSSTVSVCFFKCVAHPSILSLQITLSMMSSRITLSQKVLLSAYYWSLSKNTTYSFIFAYSFSVPHQAVSGNYVCFTHWN